MKRTASNHVHSGLLWIMANQDAWMELQRICVELEAMRNPDGSCKYSTLTRDGIYMLAQLEGMEITNDKAFKRDHDLWSTLVRYLIALHPQLSRVFSVRSCGVGSYTAMVGLPQLADVLVYERGAA